MKETTIYTKLRDRIVDSVAIKLDLVSASGIKSDMFTNWTILFAFCCLLGGLAGKKEKKPVKTEPTKDNPLRSAELPDEDGGFIVTLAIFSGVEDPEWNLTNNNPRYAEVRRLFRRATTYGPEHMPGKLGYEGFLVQEVTNGNVQPLVLVFGTESVQLQLLLLQTIPTNMIPTSLKNIIREAIQNGNVSAQLDHRTTKRNAPRYRPELWNDRLYILKNNCYNYALNVQNNCFQQPGDNSGRGASFTTTNFCSEVMQGTMSDGLVAERALGINRMREYNVPGRHLVALFCFELGRTALPIDFHFYRLDSDGFWSHKPGITQATDRDDAGRWIRDPRTAANPTGFPYRFIAFMSTNLTVFDFPSCLT